MATAKPVLSPSRRECVKIAAIAECDPRIVKKYLTGQRLSHLAAGAIRRALGELGITDPRANTPSQTAGV